MGLPWVRLDTQFASNPKVVELAAGKKWRAAFVYLASLAYAGAQGTDGYIPSNCLFLIHATRAEADALVGVGLWNLSPGGWDINGWDEFQVSDDAARKRRERAQKGAAKRWENERKARLHGV